MLVFLIVLLAEPQYTLNRPLPPIISYEEVIVRSRVSPPGSLDPSMVIQSELRIKNPTFSFSSSALLLAATVIVGDTPGAGLIVRPLISVRPSRDILITFPVSSRSAEI